MVFVPVPQQYEPPVALNALDVARRLGQQIPRDEAFRAADAVLLRVRVNANGNVTRVRALPPRIAGFIPRVMPRVPPEWVGGKTRLRWADSPNILGMAQNIGRELKFVPAKTRSGVTAASCRVVLPLHMPAEETE